MTLQHVEAAFTRKPNTNQKWLLGIGITGVLGVLIYYKFFNKPSAPVITPAATKSFVGGYDCYSSYLSADGTSGNDRCQELNDALMLVRTALQENEKNGGANLTRPQITKLKGQEMELLSLLQTNNCS